MPSSINQRLALGLRALRSFTISLISFAHLGTKYRYRDDFLAWAYGT